MNTPALTRCRSTIFQRIFSTQCDCIWTVMWGTLECLWDSPLIGYHVTWHAAHLTCLHCGGLFFSKFPIKQVCVISEMHTMQTPSPKSGITLVRFWRTEDMYYVCSTCAISAQCIYHSWLSRMIFNGYVWSGITASDWDHKPPVSLCKNTVSCMQHFLSKNPNLLNFWIWCALHRVFTYTLWA